MKKKQKILIIGGSGSIGRKLAENFTDKGNSVTVIDKSFCKFPKAITFLHMDFDQAPLENLIKEHDIFIYLLSRLLPAISDSSLLKKDIFSYTNFIEKLKNFQNKKLLFFSSGGSVYGELIKKEPIEENQCRNPISLYGHQKKILEDLSLLYNKLYNVNVYILRVSNSYGYLSNINKLQGVIPNLIHKGLAQSLFNVWGNGSAIKDYIHIDDVTSACFKMLDYNGKFRVMNISSGIGRSLLDIINVINMNLEKDITINFEDKKDFDISYNILSNDLIKKQTAWKPEVDFNFSIKLMVESIKSDYQSHTP